MNRRVSKSCKILASVCLIFVFASFTWSQKQDDLYLKLAAEQFLSANEAKLQESKNKAKLQEDKMIVQFYLLANLAPAALAAGETEKAENYARELMVVADKRIHNRVIRSSSMGYATYISNMVLGRIALENGEIDKAKEHLLAAGRVTGRHPDLATFGPSMILAKQLLEKGERETVIQYLDLCANFWKNERGRLEKWKNIIKQGGMPDFGANLHNLDSWRFAQ